MTSKSNDFSLEREFSFKPSLLLTIYILTKYINRSSPHICHALGDQLTEFIQFHVQRLSSSSSLCNKYDDKKILESFDLYQMQGK